MKGKIRLLTVAILIVTVIITVSTGCNDSGQFVNLENTGRVITGSFHIDQYEVLKALEVFKHEYETDAIEGDEAVEKLEVLLRKMEGVDSYYDYSPYISKTKKEETFGVVIGEEPIGGGEGYSDIITKGKYTVKDAEQLVAALEKAKSGEVIFIPGDAIIDMTDFNFADNYTITLNDGVTLASDRGHKGSKGGLIFTSAIRSRPFIRPGENSRITGLNIKGPDAEERDWKNFGLGSGVLIEKSGITVDNCEISGFNYSGVEMKGGENSTVKYNYIHDNKSIGKGYGVSVETTTGIIEYNLFNNNRNSVHGNGRPGCGIEIRNNVFLETQLEESIKMDTFERQDNKMAGEYLKVYNNTFLSEQTPISLEVIPNEGLEIRNNFFPGKEETYNDMLEHLKVDSDKVLVSNNEFGLFDVVDTTYDLNYFTGKHTPDMRLTNITARIFYGDLRTVYNMVLELKGKLEEEAPEEGIVGEYVTSAVKEIERYDRAYDYFENPNVTIDGVVYGAIPDDQPLGGGYGYKDIYTTGDYVVENTKELIHALLDAKEGEVVFVKGDAVIDLTNANVSLTINDGVTLASDRGNGDSTGALIYSDAFFSPLFKTGENVRITGLTFKGADPDRRIKFHARSFYGDAPKGSSYYYKLPTLDAITTGKNNLEVDNCEFSGWSHGAIYISGGSGHYVHHNYIHHNQRNGLGYGIVHGKAVSLIEYNLLNANRHDIAGTGIPGSGYEARHNVQMGESLSHCFDMHGGRDRGDGSNIAGDTILMHHNTFLSDELPYAIRGVPQDIQDFYNNALFPPLSAYNDKKLYGSNDAEKEKFVVRDNVFNLKDKPEVVK